MLGFALHSFENTYNMAWLCCLHQHWIKTLWAHLKNLWFIFLVHLLRVRIRSGSLCWTQKQLENRATHLILLDAVWHWLLLRKESKECPENDEDTYLKCNLVNFVIPKLFYYVCTKTSKTKTSIWDLKIHKITFQIAQLAENTLIKLQVQFLTEIKGL